MDVSNYKIVKTVHIHEKQS